MSTVKAILIDVTRKQVRQVDVPAKDNLQALYDLVKCDTIDIVGLGGGIDCVVDDEALCKEASIDEDGTKHGLHGFSFPGFRRPVIGNGLLVSHGEDGDLIDVLADSAVVEKLVRFVEYDNPERRPEPHIEVYAF